MYLSIRKIYYITVTLLGLTIYSSNGLFAADASNIYGSVPPWDYLTGRFNPAQHELFVSLAGFGIPVNRSPQYLRREAAKALKEMHAAFIKDHPGIRFWVQSSTRNFFDQKYIWEGKWNGTITVMGKRLDKTISDPLKRAVEILKYSSVPGGSRHHWGTDVDLNVLSNNYYEGGEGLVLNRWLEKNAARFGFCRPYTAGRKSGHEEERWHWSYFPLAKIFIAEWNRYYKKQHRGLSDRGFFFGSSEAGRLAPLYMNSINQDCE